jgi:23S rRNA (guanosine2251-2'-O)-methyltransferase
MEGRNAVFEALKGNRVVRVMIAHDVENTGQQMRAITDLSRENGVLIESTTLAELDRLSATGHHQGIIAYVKPPNGRSFKHILMDTPVVHRVSMGGSLYVPVVKQSLYSALKLLRTEGIRIIGVDPSGSMDYFSENLSGAIALVLGGEDRGISPPLLERCDSVVRIPMLGRLETLNVSVATAIVLYERVRQRRH